MDASQIPPNRPEKLLEPPELIADPSRQAIPLIKGIDYQIWQTVLAWMDLEETDFLVVEGAEDFDNLSKAEATMNQVKNLASSISLRSECVCDALRNFWIARHKNPGRRLRFRLITTATLSVEAKAPFGTSNAGLKLWNDEASYAVGRNNWKRFDANC